MSFPASAPENAKNHLWGSDDEAVSPFVSENVANVLGAEKLDATGEGHGSEDDAVRSLVAEGTANFFAEHLK